MRVVITGGAGFLGSRLAQAILDRGALTDAHGETRSIQEVLLVDRVAAPDHGDPRVRSLTGDLTDASVAMRAITSDTDSLFHLAAVVSGQAEADFDLGMRVNVDATRAVFERCRVCSAPMKVVFASSIAVFGSGLPNPVGDDAPLMPQSSYGTQKVIGEMLVQDMSRKGFIDGRSLRLPTITVRPGKPNRAASSFASGMVREPLSGVVAVCPVRPETRMWVQSPRAVIENLIVGHEAPAARFAHSRAVNVPGITVAMSEIVSAMRRVAGEAVADRVLWEYDPVIDRIVSTWPACFTAQFGTSLGMKADRDFESIVRAYIADDTPAAVR